MTQITTDPPVVGIFNIHSVILELITSHILSQIYSTTLVMLVYDRDTVLQVVHNRGHDFQKDLPCRGAQIATHTHDQPRKNQIKTQRGFHDKAITGFRNISGGHPIE